jgi:hypothetical protein
MPASNMKRNNDDPPELKKGNETPVGGIEFVTTATFRRLCTAIREVIPTARRLPKVSGALSAIFIPRQMKIVNNNSTTTTPINPSSSARIENIKSLCGSGIHRNF